MRPALQRAGTEGGASAPAGAPVLLVFSLISILLDDRLTSVYRPVQENRVRFNPTKAEFDLDWEPTVDFDRLVRMMVDADLERLTTGG